MNYPELAFKHLTRNARAADYIAWAEGLLARGCHVMAVVELACHALEPKPDLQEVQRSFEQCAAELGLQVPGDDDWYPILIDYSCSICQEMRDAVRDAEDGLSELLCLAEDNNDPYLLTVWQDLDDGLHAQRRPCFDARLGSEPPQASILRTAVQYMSMCAMQLPEKFPWVWWCLTCGHVTEGDTWTDRQSDACPRCGAEATLANMRYFENRDRLVAASSRPSSPSMGDS